MSRPLITAVHPSLTRPLRQAVLRPQQPLEALAAHEPPGSFALAARTLYERAGLVIVSAVFEIEPIGLRTS